MVLFLNFFKLHMAQSPGLVSKHCQKLLFLNVLKNEINQLFIPNNYCSTYFNHFFYKNFFWGGYIKAFQKTHFFPVQGEKNPNKTHILKWVFKGFMGFKLTKWAQCKALVHIPPFFPQSMSLGQKQGSRGLKYDKSENIHFLGVGGLKQA